MIAVSLIMTATQSCSDKEVSSSEPGISAPAITFTGTTAVPSPVIEEEGGSAEVRFTASASWTATVSESRGIDWLTVSPASGEGGDAMITVTAQPNPNYEERNGAVTIACGGKTATFTVSQKQTDAMILSTDKVEIGSDATTIEIRLKSNVEVEYEIAGEDVEWIKPSQASRSMTEKTLCFDISANGDTAGRTGHIGIKGAGKTEIVSIYQQGFKPSIVLGAKEAVVGSAGGEVTVEIASNISFDAELQPCDWIREKTDGSRSSYTLRYIVDPNETYDQRSATVVISNAAHDIREVFTITQVQKDAIVVAKNEYQVPCSASELNFDIQTNIEPTVTCTESWIRRVEPRSRALHTMNLCFDIDENTSETEARSAQIIIRGADGSVRQEITVIQAVKTNNIVDGEITPLMVYSIRYLSEADAYCLTTTMHGVLKSVFEDGRNEYASVSFAYHGIWDGFWDYQSIFPTYTQFFYKDRSYSIFRGNSLGDFIDGGYHDTVRYLEREIDTDSPIKLTKFPDRCCVYPKYLYERYGHYVPRGYDFNGYDLWKDGDTWRGEYNMYELEKIGGFTDEEIRKLEKHFGKPADEIPTDWVEGLSVEQMIDIFELQNEPNPYIMLPAGTYRTNYENASRVLELADTDVKVVSVNQFEEFLNYTFKIPDSHFFVVLPENYLYPGSKRQFIESPRDTGSLDWDYTARVVEDNEYRKATEIRINGCKHYLWENALNGYPEHYSTAWADGYPLTLYPDMKLTWEVVDTLVYYKERPGAPFRVLNHYKSYPEISVQANPDYVGRKVKVTKPDWVKCDEEFVLKDGVSEFLADIVVDASESRIGYVNFYLEGSDELVDRVRIDTPKSYSSSSTTRTPEFRFNGGRPGYDGSGNLALGAEGGILECIGGTSFPDELLVTCDVDWLEPIEDLPSSRGAGVEYNFRFRVKPNPSNSERYGKLVFTGADSFRYTQGIYQHAGAECSTTVGQMRISSADRQGIGVLKNPGAIRR